MPYDSDHDGGPARRGILPPFPALDEGSEEGAGSRDREAAGPPPPVADRRAPGAPTDGADAGTLVLIGGACDPMGEAFHTFLGLAGALDGERVVGLTTASGDPVGSALEWTEAFDRAGARNVEFPIVDRRDRAQDPEIAEMIRGAGAIFLGGGDQVQLVATVDGSRVGRAIREAYQRGAVVCGTSAGAAALTETILAGGEPDETGTMQEMHLGPGFGMLGFRAVIDTHFAQRRRLQRLFMVVAQNPDLMGLGIDEDTAMVVRGHLGEVVGKGGVTFVDGRGVRFDNAEEALQGAPLTLSYLRVGVVGAGYTFDLRARELEVLVRARERPEAAEVIRGVEAEGPAG